MGKPLHIAGIGLDQRHVSMLGSAGYIELRKYVDTDERPGADRVFVVNGSGTRHIDASRWPLSPRDMRSGSRAIGEQRMDNGPAAGEVRRAAGK